MQRTENTRILAITTMRNEAPFVLEWIAYHQHIGVTDFLVYSNDCEDGTDVLLDRLDALGVIHHARNHSRGKKTVQWRALSKAQRHPAYAAADWIFVTDVDEFLNIHAGDGKIADLIAAAPDAHGFAIPWRMFGNNGAIDFHDKPVLEQFTQAAPEALLWPWRAVQYKSLYRQDARYEKLGVHRPKLRAGQDRGHWVDGNGGPLPDNPNLFQYTTEPRYGLAQINHYAVGAIKSFLVKVARGKPNHTSDPIDLAYWTDRNFATHEDTRIMRHQRAVCARVTDLMADAEVRRLHLAGVAWRQAKIHAILQTLEGHSMFASLLQIPPTQPLSMQAQTALLSGLIKMKTAERATAKSARG
jgi:hypothetical protein